MAWHGMALDGRIGQMIDKLSPMNKDTVEICECILHLDVELYNVKRKILVNCVCWQ